MHRLDPARPHSEVYGMDGVRFIQDGRAFNGAGTLVIEPQEAVAPATAASVAGRDQDCSESLSSGQTAPEPILARDDMRLKENRVVKIQWDQFHEGEPFPGLAEARRVLGPTA